MLPLDGLLVLDLAQYLAGPSAALRLSDLGARVVKIERPNTGDSGRQMRLADLVVGDDSLLFHTINRGKESVVVDLRNEDDRGRLRNLVEHADVLIHSFRPGALERYGFDYPSLKTVNPRLVYAQVSGYGPGGPWRDEPGQDLLVQARSGIAWLGGRLDGPPEPFALSVVDQVTGAYLAQGVLACLVRRGATGTGGLVEVSLFEAAMDLQFEVFTTYLNGGSTPVRTAVSPAHPYVDAPYGIYRTADGWLALAMGSLSELGELVGLPDLELADGNLAHDWPTRRDAVKQRLASVLATKTTDAWLSVLIPAGYWCAEVRQWPELEASGALEALDLVVECGGADAPSGQNREDARRFRTTRCPIRIDGEPLPATSVGPALGEHDSLPASLLD